MKDLHRSKGLVLHKHLPLMKGKHMISPRGNTLSLAGHFKSAQRSHVGILAISTSFKGCNVRLLHGMNEYTRSLGPWVYRANNTMRMTTDLLAAFHVKASSSSKEHIDPELSPLKDQRGASCRIPSQSFVECYCYLLARQLHAFLELHVATVAVAAAMRAKTQDPTS
jgi:hypothetical protein